MRITILGTGNMGTALGAVIARNNHKIVFWGIEIDVIKELDSRHTNTKYLAGVDLGSNTRATPDLKEALREADGVVFAVPSAWIREVAHLALPHLQKHAFLLNTAKGVEAGTGKFMTEILEEELGKKYKTCIATLSGPSIANEFGRGVPTAVMVASTNAVVCTSVKEALENESFRVMLSRDLIGVSLGGIIKNVYAILLGIADGLGLGVNTKAILLTYALKELKTVLVRLGGKKETAYGLAGLGDLLVTGMSEHSRNRSFGELLAKDKEASRKLLEDPMKTIEGVQALKTLTPLIRKKKLGLPMFDAVERIVIKNGNLKQEFAKLLSAL